MTAGATRRRDPLAAPGRVLAVGAARAAFEVRAFFRQADSVFFTFLFPVILLMIFSAAFSTEEFGRGEDAVSAATYYLPGMLAAGVLLSGLQSMALDIAGERSDGTLKRLGGTPLSPVSYFLGKLGQVLVTGALQSVVLLGVAALVFGVELPSEPARWLTFAWIFLLGVTTCAILGVGLAALPRSARSASSVVIPIVTVLQFVSGVYISFASLPDWLQQVAGVFPLKWLAQGMSSVFLPDSFRSLEPSGEWEHGTIIVVLLVWLVAGLIAVSATFRWNRKEG